MAVSHVFSNAVPDATGTLTIWYGATTATVAATDIVRPSDWNSAHDGFSTFSGNTLGASTWSGSNLVLAGTNNISLSRNGNTLSISGPDLTQYLTTAALSNHGHGASAANGSFSFQTLSFSNANGVSFGTSAGSAITASHNALTSQSNQAFSADGGSSAFQTLNFRNANGLSFSNSDGSVQASYTVPTVPAQLSVGNSNLGNTAGDTGVFTGRVVFVGSDNITLSGSSNGGSATLSIIGAAGGGGLTNIRLSAGTTSNLLSAVTFSNANGVSFGLDASTITASIATSLTNIRVSAGTTSNLLSAITFANGNGVSFGLDASTLTGSVAAQTNQTGGIYVTAQSTGQSSSSTYDVRTLSFVPDGIISAGWSNGSFRVSATQSNQNVTAGNGGFAFQTLSFSNANGVSFGTSAGSAITGSVAAQTNQSGGIYAVGNTTGQSSSSTYDARTLSVEGAGIVSVGWSNSSLRVSATQSNQAFSAGAASSTFQTLSFQDSNGLSFSNNAGAIRVSYTRNVASNAIQSVGSATGSGTNTSRFAADDHVHAGVFSVGVSNVGNTAGDTRVDVGRFVLAGGANITLSQATAANALNTISIVGATAAPAPVNFSAGTTSNNLGSVVFSNSNGVSFGLNGSTITASAAGGAADGGVFAGVSTDGNTAGSTGTVSTGNFVLVGSNGITLSQSTGAAGSAATVTIANWPHCSYWNNGPHVSAITGTLNANNSQSRGVNLLLPYALSIAFLRLQATAANQSLNTTTAVNSSAGATLATTFNMVLYSQGTGASSLSLVSVSSTSLLQRHQMSWTAGAVGSNYTTGGTLTYAHRGSTASWTSTLAVSSASIALGVAGWGSFSGGKLFDLPWQASLSPGAYVLGIGSVTSSTTAGSNINQSSWRVGSIGSFVFNRMQNSQSAEMGQTLSSLMRLGLGIYSTNVVGGTLSAMHQTVISTAASNPILVLEMARFA